MLRECLTRSAQLTALEHNGKPHVRMKERGKPVLYRISKDGTTYQRPSKKWHFELRDANGTVRRIMGYADLKATEQLAAELERKASRVRSGFSDPAEEHAGRPLAEHLKDYAAAMEAKGHCEARSRYHRPRVGSAFRLWVCILQGCRRGKGCRMA